MLERSLGALAIFVFGFDFIWLGCKYNGADNDRNPVWEFLDGFITLQKYILILAAYILILVALGYVWNKFLDSKPEYSGFKWTREETSHHTPAPQALKEWAPRRMPEVPKPEYFRPQEQIFKAELVKPVVSESLKPVPQKSKLTAKELKEKAIAELLGRS